MLAVNVNNKGAPARTGVSYLSGCRAEWRSPLVIESQGRMPRSLLLLTQHFQSLSSAMISQEKEHREKGFPSASKEHVPCHTGKQCSASTVQLN